MATVVNRRAIDRANLFKAALVQANERLKKIELVVWPLYSFSQDT